MNIAEIVEIALAGSDERRVELAALEPADVSMEVVSSLASLLAELVDNAIALSGPEEVVRVTGLHERGDYLISISDRGVGLPEHLLAELNRLLQDPDASRLTDPKPGISLVARLASRHGLGVKLVPGAPGTTARVTIPGRLVSDVPGRTAPSRPMTRPEPTSSGHLPSADIADRPVFEPTVDLSRFERDHRVGSGVVAMTDEARREAESFLEKVFRPLVENPGQTERPAAERMTPPEPDEEGPVTGEDPGRVGTVTDLRVRVPGENFSLVEDDPSTMAAEGAIDIRSALSRYQQGKRSAEETRYHN